LTDEAGTVIEVTAKIESVASLSVAATRFANVPGASRPPGDSRCTGLRGPRRTAEYCANYWLTLRLSPGVGRSLTTRPSDRAWYPKTDIIRSVPETEDAGSDALAWPGGRAKAFFGDLIRGPSGSRLCHTHRSTRACDDKPVGVAGEWEGRGPTHALVAQHKVGQARLRRRVCWWAEPRWVSTRRLCETWVSMGVAFGSDARRSGCRCFVPRPSDGKPERDYSRHRARCGDRQVCQSPGSDSEHTFHGVRLFVGRVHRVHDEWSYRAMQDR
jgi:hypothetical protein